MADHVSNEERDRLTDLTFFAASAGGCFVVAGFCVIVPFFLKSDVASSLLLLGFFLAAGGTVFFGLRSWEAEKDVQKRMIGARLTR
jgi:UPF0716 family protein affecting phage T7 exclusion